MTATDVRELALKVPVEERFLLVESLLESLDKSDPEIDRVWADEAERRLAAHRSGAVLGISAEDVLRDD